MSSKDLQRVTESVSYIGQARFTLKKWSSPTPFALPESLAIGVRSHKVLQVIGAPFSLALFLLCLTIRPLLTFHPLQSSFQLFKTMLLLNSLRIGSQLISPDIKVAAEFVTRG